MSVDVLLLSCSLLCSSHPVYFTLSGALVLAGTRAGAGQWIVCGDRCLACGVVEFNASRGCASCAVVMLVDTLLVISAVLPAGAVTFALVVVQSLPP